MSPTDADPDRPMLAFPAPLGAGARAYDAFPTYDTQLFGHLDGAGASSLPPYFDEFIDPSWSSFSPQAHAAYPEKTLFGRQSTPASLGLAYAISRGEPGPDPRSGTPRSESQTSSSNKTHPDVEYPVIVPLLPYCSRQISPALACKLLEGYFSTFSDHDFYASSPFLLSHVLRRHSILTPTEFRPCKPSLLASMLLVAAQTVEMPFFGSAPTARHRLCQVLFEITVGLLGSNPPVKRSALPTGRGQPPAGQDRRLVGSAQSLAVAPSTRSIDDVIAYMHLAIISSAAESKQIGSHWWHTAVQLAKELKFNIEVPAATTEPRTKTPSDTRHSAPDITFSPASQRNQRDRRASTTESQDPGAGEDHEENPSPMGMVDNTVTEDEGVARRRAGIEGQEERRRVWWSLYVLDRHFALCYNSPLALRDFDCQDTLWPLDDASWQAGSFGSANPSEQNAGGSPETQPRGPSAECFGSGIFGLLIPFAFILGQIIDARQILCHPRYVRTPTTQPLRSIFVQEVGAQLDVFGGSLDRLAIIAPLRDSEAAPQLAETDANSATVESLTSSRVRYQRLMVTYGHYLLHISRVLLHGEWDLLTALNDTEHSLTPTGAQDGGNLLACATQAAEALQNVLSQDHELKFNPFLIGIFLVQGSYPLLATASRQMQRSSTQVLKACKITVRAHEACVATLHSEYQRKNRKLLLSAIEGIQYGPSAITREMASLNERIIKLYRWAPGGRGLGL